MPTQVLVLNQSWLVTGSGNPEGAQFAPVGSLFLREDGAGGTSLYVKETGAGNTGWKALGGSGAPTAHRTTHETGGTDALTALDAGILTTGTLPAARLTAANLPAHASRHNTGGADALTALDASILTTGLLPDARLSTNVALLNASNTFTNRVQQLVASTPFIGIADTAQPVDSRAFIIQNSGGILRLTAYNDVYSVPAGSLTLTRAGVLLLTSTSATFPEIQWSITGTTQKAHLGFLTATSGPHLSANLLYTGAGGWNRDDTSLGGSILAMTPGAIGLYVCASGVNPASLIQGLSIATTGAVTIPTTLALTGRLTCGADIVTSMPIYPGRYDAAWAQQGSWYLASHGSYGLFSNTGLYCSGPIWSAAGIYAANHYDMTPLGVADAATIIIDASTRRSLYYVIIGASRTLGTPTNPTDGQKMTILVYANGGNFTLTLDPAAFHFGADITGTTPTGNGLSDYIGCQYTAWRARWDVVAYVKGY